MSPPFHRSAAADQPTLVGFSEEQLRFLAESIPQIAWTAMPDGYIDYMNERWFEYTGLSPEETYRELKTAVHPDDHGRYRRAWTDAVKTGAPYEVEYRFLRASDGMYRWHLGRGCPVRDFQGNIIKWFGTCTDIHAQKEAGEELRRMNERLETVVMERTAHLQQEVLQRRKSEQKNVEHLELLQRMVNSLPLAAAAVSSFGKILHANEAFHFLFAANLTSEELIGASCDGLFQNIEKRLPSPAWASVRKQMMMVEAFGEEVTVSDGRTFFIEYIPTEESGGYLLLARDISEEKRVDTVKGEFMSLASHQLRTPLTSIRWAIGRLDRTLKGRLSPEEQRLLDKTRESASVMAQTIRTMLTISRVEAGLHLAAPTDVVIREFFEEIHEAFADAAIGKSLRFIVKCPGNLVVHTDPLILREIIENLVSNAIKYTLSEGSVFMEAEAMNDGIALRVRDTGMGIPEHQQEKVFSKFFRGENVLRVDTEGTGLGLYLVSRLTEVLHGTMNFESTVGKGTTFTLLLPG